MNVLFHLFACLIAVVGDDSTILPSSFQEDVWANSTKFVEPDDTLGPKYDIVQKPHILFVVMDDLGSNDLGYHGSGIHTPVADSIARRGLQFRNFYTLPTCTTTRMALMTGRYPYRFGQYEVVRSKSTIGMPLDEETLPQVLRTAGYQAHAIGKWHLGHARREQTPTYRGFQSFLGFHVSGMQRYWSHRSPYNKTSEAFDLRYEPKEFCGRRCSQIFDARGKYSSLLYGQQAAKVVEDYDERQGPLFLYLAFQADALYAAMLTAADDGLGMVVDALKAKKLWKDTLVIYMTDNGGSMNGKVVRKRKIIGRVSDNSPSRGGKKDIWEGGVLGEAFIGGEARSALGIIKGPPRTNLS